MFIVVTQNYLHFSCTVNEMNNPQILIKQVWYSHNQYALLLHTRSSWLNCFNWWSVLDVSGWYQMVCWCRYSWSHSSIRSVGADPTEDDVCAPCLEYYDVRVQPNDVIFTRGDFRRRATIKLKIWNINISFCCEKTRSRHKPSDVRREQQP